jgi:hypothetical protein
MSSSGQAPFDHCNEKITIDVTNPGYSCTIITLIVINLLFTANAIPDRKQPSNARKLA